MEYCPNCGCEISSQIYVPLSEINKGLKTIHCKCGYVITYKVAGYDEQKRKEELERIAKNTTVEELNRAYKIFVNITYILSIISLAFFWFYTPNGPGKEDMSVVLYVGGRLLLVIVSGLGLLYPFFMARIKIRYIEGVGNNKATALIMRLLGLAILFAVIINCIYSGLQTIGII